MLGSKTSNALENQSAVYGMHLKFMRGLRKDYMKEGESKVGQVGLHGSKTTSSPKGGYAFGGITPGILKAC